VAPCAIGVDVSDAVVGWGNVEHHDVGSMVRQYAGQVTGVY
jgi:hypothetical protein